MIPNRNNISELNKLRKIADKNIEEQINFNILNFIYTIHLNADDFIEMSYDSKFFGDIEMIFKKKQGRLWD